MSGDGSRVGTSAMVPKRYGLGSGEVVGADGSRSKALDIVIFDDLHSVVFKSIGGKVLCPAESVFGTIEVKTTLNTEELGDGISKGQSLAKISRRKTDAFQFTPTAGFQLGAGLVGDHRTRHHYVTGIVAINAMRASRIVVELNRRKTQGGATLTRHRRMLEREVDHCKGEEEGRRKADCGRHRVGLRRVRDCGHGGANNHSDEPDVASEATEYQPSEEPSGEHPDRGNEGKTGTRSTKYVVT